MSSPTGNLSLTIDNVEQRAGNFYAAFYNRKNGFLEDKQHIRVEVLRQQNGRNQQFKISNLPTGELAIAVFQDLNGNSRLDKNLAGIPTEPYGFSQNVRPRFRAPRWEECFFSLQLGENEHKILVEKW